MARFTDLWIARQNPKARKFSITEGDGLYLQISPKGKKTWLHLHRTKAGNKWVNKWINLGEFPAMSVADARKRNKEAERFAVITAEPTEHILGFNPTLNDVFQEWYALAKGKATKSKAAKPWSAAYRRNVKYMFEATVLPVFGEKRLRDIHKADIRALLEKKEKTHPSMALELYRRLSRLFNYAAEKDYIEASPMSTLPQIGSEQPKNRFLSDEEIKVFLTSLPCADMSPKTANVLELILRTGQRPGEVCGASKTEMQEGVWVIPGNRTKNGLEQRVPLTKKIKELFGEANAHGLFFPSPKASDKPLAVMALSQALRRSLTGKEKGESDTAITIPVAPFCPHDLRRTCATGLQGIKTVRGEVIAKILNHKPRTVTGQHYEKHDFSAEKRKAIEAWERKLNAILGEISSDNVVPFTAKGA